MAVSVDVSKRYYRWKEVSSWREVAEHDNPSASANTGGASEAG
jgi:hypothetical protein